MSTFTAISCSSLCILTADRPTGFTHPLDFGDLHPASNCCSSSLLNIDVTSFQPRKLAPWTYTEKQTSSSTQMTGLHARSAAARAGPGGLTGSHSPACRVDGHPAKQSRLGDCSKWELLCSKQLFPTEQRVRNLAGCQRLAGDVSEHSWAPGRSAGSVPAYHSTGGIWAA